VACDDTYAPKQYFDFFSITRVKVHVVATEDGKSVAQHVLEKLLSYETEEDDERWMLLDTDHCTQGNHLPSFIRAITDAKQRGVKVALSKPCFEFWLLLHHIEDSHVEVLPNADHVERKLRMTLGEYNKTSLKLEHYPLASVADACQRAERLDGAVTGGDIPISNTSRVYLLWKAIAAKALPSQLPPELRSLLPQAVSVDADDVG
jgi:hypothetical protein